jgi:ubiquinone/menaquinone biosynthesis C-methylase UbiE
MMMESSTIQKQLAIDQHSRQADEFHDRYKVLDEDAYKNCFTYSRMRLNLWLDRFLPPSGAGLRLLDVGCGTGYHLSRYRERGFEVAGIDGSEDMLMHARAANPDIEFLQSDVDKIPYPDASFDLILSI